jgi:hypothetical protein
MVLPFSDNAMNLSDEQRGFVVETFFKNNESVIATRLQECVINNGRHLRDVIFKCV